MGRANAGSGCFKALIGRSSNRGNPSTKDKGINYSIVLVPFFIATIDELDCTESRLCAMILLASHVPTI